jgi:uncharacterized metal-binding protein
MTTPSDSTRQPLPCVLACSGCSKAGELADHTARRLQERGVAKMSCLAGVGGRVKSILATIQNAPEILMIDGCPLECGGNGLKLAGISNFQHFKLHEVGIRKNQTQVAPGTVETLADTATALLSKERPLDPGSEDRDKTPNSNLTVGLKRGKLLAT